MTDPKDSAFPAYQGGMGAMGIGFMPTTGLTKREHFAAMAMQGILPGDTLHFTNYVDPHSLKDYAELAVRIADALIIELNKDAQKRGE